MKPVLLAMLGLAAVPMAVAQGVHTHGEADLAVVIDGDSLFLELRADLSDLVGFERAPETAEEEASLAGLHARFEEGEAPFSFTGRADCSLSEVVTAGGMKDHLGHDGHDHDNHDHADDHDHEVHLLVVSWSFACGDAERLRRIETTLFDEYPAIQRIDVAVLGDRGQTGARLTPQNAALRLP